MGFLLFVLIASIVGIAIVLFVHRPRTSTELSIRELGQGLEALAPQPGSDRGARPRSTE
jgi:hypothetical protein